MPEKNKTEEQLADLYDKITEYRREIDKLRKETLNLQKQKVMDSRLFNSKVVKELFTIFNINPKKITNCYDDFIEFQIPEYKMQIQINPTEDLVKIHYEPILNFDGGIDPEGHEEVLDLSTASVCGILESINSMQITYLKSKLEETFFVEKNINKIEEMMESYK